MLPAHIHRIVLSMVMIAFAAVAVAPVSAATADKKDKAQTAKSVKTKKPKTVQESAPQRRVNDIPADRYDVKSGY